MRHIAFLLLLSSCYAIPSQEQMVFKTGEKVCIWHECSGVVSGAEWRDDKIIYYVNTFKCDELQRAVFWESELSSGECKDEKI